MIKALERNLFTNREMLEVLTALCCGETRAAACRRVPLGDVALLQKTLRRKPKWAAIFKRCAPDMAFAAMDKARDEAWQAAEGSRNAQLLAVAGKATAAMARALDPATWAERPNGDMPPVLMVKTNLDFGSAPGSRLEDAMHEVQLTLPAAPVVDGEAQEVENPACLLDPALDRSAAAKAKVSHINGLRGSSF